MKKDSRKKKSTAKEKNKGGRPSKYPPKVTLKQIELIAKLGAKDAEIAEILGIAESTLNKYKIEYPKFMESIKKGKRKYDAEIIDSLRMRGKGFYKVEEQAFCYKGEIIKAKVKKYYPPETAAAFIWAKNRRPFDWRDRREIVEVNVKPKTIIIKRAKKEEKEDE